MPAIDYEDYLRFALALAFVLALIVAIGWVARRLGLGGAPQAPSGRRRRLGVVEALPVDAKRRLVLVRRDGVEHLVLLGTGSETLVEAGIRPPDDGGAASSTTDRQSAAGPGR